MPSVETGTSDQTLRTPADETYTRLTLRHNELLKEAGAFLARSLQRHGAHTPTALRLAEEFATEANEVAAEMKAWRLAHGYDA